MLSIARNAEQGALEALLVSCSQLHRDCTYSAATRQVNQRIKLKSAVCGNKVRKAKKRKKEEITKEMSVK